MAYTFKGNEAHADAWFVEPEPVNFEPQRCELCVAWLHSHGSSAPCAKRFRTIAGKRYRRVTLDQDGARCEHFERGARRPMETGPADRATFKHAERVADVRRPGRKAKA